MVKFDLVKFGMWLFFGIATCCGVESFQQIMVHQVGQYTGSVWKTWCYVLMTVALYGIALITAAIRELTLAVREKGEE